jgi:two-component sensor histidine kinase
MLPLSEEAKELAEVKSRVESIAKALEADYPYSQNTVWENLWAIEQGSLGRDMACNDWHELFKRIKSECASILMLMDGLAEQWGDEGVFRRCRDRLRAIAETPEKFAPYPILTDAER